jgi:dihydroxyacid dehydratase/phosphogluconate dehydratase
VDTLMRTLSEKRFIDDRAATLDGSWMHRITDARSANGIFFHSTMTPSSPNSGLVRLHGNVGTGALARVGSADAMAKYDQKFYFADFYLGRGELAEVLSRPKGPLERIRKKVAAADLYRTCRLNWADRASLNGANMSLAELAKWEKKRLWDYLIELGLLRVILFVGGEGPRASGMPEVNLIAAGSELASTCVIATDGRVTFAERDLSIAHIVPEAIEGGPLASVRTGDWIYLNLRKGEFQIVTSARTPAGFKAVSDRELARRPENKKRIAELQRRRSTFLPSVRAVLDSVSSAATGVSPISA